MLLFFSGSGSEFQGGSAEPCRYYRAFTGSTVPVGSAAVSGRLTALKTDRNYRACGEFSPTAGLEGERIFKEVVFLLCLLRL